LSKLNTDTAFLVLAGVGFVDYSSARQAWEGARLGRQARAAVGTGRRVVANELSCQHLIGGVLLSITLDQAAQALNRAKDEFECRADALIEPDWAEALLAGVWGDRASVRGSPFPEQPSHKSSSGSYSNKLKPKTCPENSPLVSNPCPSQSDGLAVLGWFSVWGR